MVGIYNMVFGFAGLVSGRLMCLLIGHKKLSSKQ